MLRSLFLRFTCSFVPSLLQELQALASISSTDRPLAVHCSTLKLLHHTTAPLLALQELQDLASISSPDGIPASRTATALRQRRLSIRLCRASYDLLTQFLQSTRQLVMLGIVNEHIKFEVGGDYRVELTTHQSQAQWAVQHHEASSSGPGRHHEQRAAIHTALPTHAACPHPLLVLRYAAAHLRTRPPCAPSAWQVFEGAPATVAELAAVEEDLTAGAMQADVVATNQQPLELQLLQVGRLMDGQGGGADGLTSSVI